MTLSASDATTIRNSRHTFSGPRFLTVNAVPLEIVATALVNQATIAYPLAQLTVDTTSADWLTEGKRGRMVMVGTAPGLHDVTVGVLRADVGATTLTIDPKQNGEPGWPVSVQQLLADNLFVSIVKFRPAWGLMSSIRKGKFYKNWDDAFSPNSDRNPFDLVNLGRHQQAYVDPDTGLARFTIDVSRFHWSGQSYSSHTWGLDGQTQISASSTQLVVDCEPGCHEITYALTNNKGKVTTAYRYLFANDDSDFPPLNAQYSLGEIDCQQDRQGATYTLSFQEPIDDSILFPGQLILMTETPQWGSNTPDDLDDPEGVVTHHVGYVTEAQTRTARGERTTTVTLESPVKLARQVPVEKQIIIESKTPGNWAEVTKKLSNPVGMFYYLSMLHAPYLINGHDFHFGEDEANSTSAYLLGLRRKVINLDQDVTLGGQLEQLSRLLDGEGTIGSRCDGTTVMMRCPMYFATSRRNALLTQWTYNAGDIEGELERPLRFRASVGKTFAGAFAFNGSSQSQAFRSMAPGYVRSQAGGEVTMDDTTVTNAGGQARVNELSGFHHARQNKRSAAFGFAMNGNMDVAEPCDMHHWWALTLGVSYDPFGEGWTSARLLMERVTRRWSGPGTRRKQITVEVEPESFGYPGVTVPLNPGAGGAWVAKPAPPYFEPYQTRGPDLGIESVAPIMAWNNILRLGRTFNFAQPQTHYALMLTDVLFAKVDDTKGYFVDPENPMYTGILTYDEDAGLITLLELNDTRDNPLTESNYTTKKIWTIDTRHFFNQAVWLNDTAISRRQIMIYRNHAGTHVYRSGVDEGSGWDAGEVFGHPDPVPEANGENSVIPVGASMFSNHAVFTAHEGDKNADGDFIYSVYYAADYDSEIVKIDNPTDWQVMPHCIAFTSSTNAIVGLYKLASPEPEDPLDIITFTPSTDYTHYTITGTGGSSGVFSFAGTHQAFADIDATGGPSGVACNVKVDLTAHYTFNSVTFDVNWTVTAPTGRRGVVTISALDEDENLIASKEFETEGAFPDDVDPHTYTAEQCGFDGLQIWYLVVSVYLEWQDSGTETITVFIDNIDIDADLVEYERDQALYTLNPTDGTYTKRDSFQLVPFHHFGIAADGSDVMALCRNEDGNEVWLLRSTNSGQTWSKVRRADGFNGLKFFADVLVDGVSCDIVLPFGINRLGISLDGGDTLYDGLGDWAAKMGYVGTIEGITGVL